MSDPIEQPEDALTPAPEASVAETPSEHIAAVQKKKNLYLRITSSMPLVVTIIVHLILFAIAGAVVVQQSSSEKKRSFEAANQAEDAGAKQVEHRLQVARRGGASGGAQSPVSANRIVSSASGGLSLPEMPDLPSMGAGGFGGFGGMGSGVGIGAGVGMATSLGGGTGLGGRGFMSLNFLGSTTQNVSNIIFVVDTSTEIMEPRKGGFQAFSIIREEIMRLVGRLPPTARFNVVLFNYDSGNDMNQVSINLFKSELAPATTDNKKAFFEWMTPVNTQLGRFGPNSAGSRTAWRMKELPESSGIDPLVLAPVWARAVQPALEQQPDAIFVITASQGAIRQRVSDAVIAKRREQVRKSREEFDQQMKREGFDPNAVIAARSAAHNKASAELAAANRSLVAQKKDPIIIRWIGDIERSDVQAELRRNKLNIRLDSTGWSRKDGSRINIPGSHVSTVETLPWNDFLSYYARMQRALVPERPALNLFLFVGPTDKPEQAITNLTNVARRNGGSFQLLTTQRLEEIKARALEEEARLNR